ncbi:hypothetical protein L6452_09495 [Arctium lappa]|uniref:Uncharacterized protein n=1 Tax=Arctium lappa TaxID=4217 RepID=A0ACB9DKG3_ARCLA|nr:hypothetical protein L6452_09495 [Arctium lappa]
MQQFRIKIALELVKGSKIFSSKELKFVDSSKGRVVARFIGYLAVVAQRSRIRGSMVYAKLENVDKWLNFVCPPHSMESSLPRPRKVLSWVLDGSEWRVELGRSFSRMALVTSSGLVKIAALVV